MVKGLSSAAIAAIALAVGASMTANAQAPVWVGIVRADGYLIPIAEVSPKLFDPPYIASEWPFRNLEWTMSDGRRTPVAVRTIEEVSVRMPYCSDRQLWRTTVTPVPVPAYVVPIRKIGVAVSGGAIEQPEDVTNQPDAASRRVAQLIVRLAHTKEAERLATLPRERWPTNRYAERSQAPVHLQRLQRHTDGGVSTYYFEASKPWLARSVENGLVTGWIVDSPNGLRSYDVSYKFNDDIHKENDHAIVWGILPYHGRYLWVLEWHGWESEYYTLHDWPSGVTRHVVDAYDC